MGLGLGLGEQVGMEDGLSIHKHHTHIQITCVSKIKRVQTNKKHCMMRERWSEDLEKELSLQINQREIRQ